MKHFYLFIITLLVSNLGFGQTTIAVEDYDSGTPNWTSTVFPATYNISSDYWAIRSSNNDPSGTTGDFWAIRDLNNSNGGGNFDHTLTYDAIDITSYESVSISFDFYTIGFDSSDRIEYEIFYGPSGSEVGQGVVALNKNTTAWTNVSVAIPDTADSAYLVITARQDGGSDYAGVDNVTIEGTLITSDTRVEFASASASVSEGSGSFDLTLSITNEDALNATTCDVAILTGDPADVDNYTTQMVTFPMASATDETVTVTITDDGTFEPDETITFQIQNVAGGNNAAVGTISTFDLTIEKNDPDPSVNIFCEPFDTNNQYDVTLGGEGNDGTQDYFQRTDGANINQSYTGANGDFFAGQDLDDGGWTGSANPSQLTWTGIDISNFTSLGFKGSFASNGGGIDSPDFVLVEYQIDGGGWTNLIAFENNDATNTFFLEDTDFDGTGDGTSLTTTFTNYTKSIGSTGSLLDLRITVSLNSADEEVAFDDLKITGIYSGLAYSGGTWTPSAPDGSSGASNAIILDGTAVLSSDASLDDVTVNPGAGLQVNTGVTLTATSVTLESESYSYSSLILDGTITATTVNYNRFVNSNGGGNDLITPPLDSQTWSDFLSTGTNAADLLDDGMVGPTTYAFAPFDKSSTGYVNYDSSSSVTLESGTGYRVATDAGTTLTFEGTPLNGTQDVDIIDSGSSFPEWNLMGNPYPSYIDADLFLNHIVSTATSGERNIDLTESGIYGYDGDASNGWDIVTLANSSGRLLAPGQGFFVAADDTGTLIADHNIEFTDAMRTTGTSDDFILGRNSSPFTFLELKASTVNNNYSTEFYFNANSSRALDRGYDAKLFGGFAPDFALYSHVVENNSGLPIALQSLGETDYNDIIIPLGVNANAGETLTFSITENTLPSNINIYLEDNVTNTFTLLNDGDYNLLPSSALNGTGRFYLRLSSTVLSIDDTNALNALSIFNDSNRDIVIAGELLQPTTAKIYDLQGRLVTSQSLDIASREQRISTNNISTGVYVIQLSNDLQNMSQKIIIR